MQGGASAPPIRIEIRGRLARPSAFRRSLACLGLLAFLRDVAPAVAAASRVSIGLVRAALRGARAEAQAKDDFVRALIDLSQAAGGATGREGPALQASLDAMAQGLARVGRGRRPGSRSGSQAPSRARLRRGGPHARHAGRHLSRSRTGGRRAAASRSGSRARPVLRGRPTCCAASQTRGSTGPTAAAAAYAAARQLEPCIGSARRTCISAPLEEAATERRSAARRWRRCSTAVRAERRAGAADDFARLPLIDLLDDASVDAPLFVPAAYVAGFRPARAGQISRGAGEPPRGGGRRSAGHARRAPATLNPADERARIAKADALVAVRRSAGSARQPARHGAPAPGLGPGALAPGTAGRGRRRSGGRAAVLRRRRARCAPRGGRVDRARGDRTTAAHGARISTPLRAATNAASRWRRGPRRRTSISDGVSGAGSARRCAWPSTRPRRWSILPARARAAAAGQLRGRPGRRRGRDRAAAARGAARRQSRRSALRPRPRAAARRTRATNREQQLPPSSASRKPRWRRSGAASKTNARARIGAARRRCRQPTAGAVDRTPGEAVLAWPRALAGLGAAVVAAAPRAILARDRPRRAGVVSRTSPGPRACAVRHANGASAEQVSRRDDGVGRRALRCSTPTAGSISFLWTAARSPTRPWRAGPASAVPQPARRHVPPTSRRRRASAAPPTAWAPAPATWTTTARIDLYVTGYGAQRRCIATTAAACSPTSRARRGVGAARWSTSCAFARHGPRRRPRPVRRQLPRRRARQQPRSAATRSGACASTAIRSTTSGCRACSIRNNGKGVFTDVSARCRRRAHVGNGLGVGGRRLRRRRAARRVRGQRRGAQLPLPQRGGGALHRGRSRGGRRRSRRDGKAARAAWAPSSPTTTATDGSTWSSPITNSRRTACSATTGGGALHRRHRRRAAWAARRCRSSASASRSSTSTTAAAWTSAIANGHVIDNTALFRSGVHARAAQAAVPQSERAAASWRSGGQAGPGFARRRRRAARSSPATWTTTATSDLLVTNNGAAPRAAAQRRARRQRDRRARRWARPSNRDAHRAPG